MAESKMPAKSPSDDLLAFAIVETFGEPCVTADADCYTCQAWAQYNKLRYRADLVEQMPAALRIIAGREQCIDNLMSKADVANAALQAYEAVQ